MKIYGVVHDSGKHKGLSAGRYDTLTKAQEKVKRLKEKKVIGKIIDIEKREEELIY